MEKDELIKILEEYEVFVDDDYGGSYQSIIAYTKDKKISKAFTSLGALKIINTFEKMQKEKQEIIDYLKGQIKEQTKIMENSKTFRTTKYQISLSKKWLCQEILSKIEKE